MNEPLVIYGKHGTYTSSPGEFMRGEGGRGTGPVVTLRNIEVKFDKCGCKDHIHLPGGPSPVIPSLGPLCRMVHAGFRDLTWNEGTRTWENTEERP